MSGYSRDSQRAYDNQAPEDEEQNMYAEDDAEGDVANQLIEAGDVHEMVTDVRAALGLLREIRKTGGRFAVDTRFTGLLRWAEKLDGMVDAQVDLMTNKGEE